MCRLAAYLGREIYLGSFFSDPEHSLVRQAWAPKEMQEARLNADGFGIGWYNNRDEAVSYKHVLPAWSDTNLSALGSSLSHDLWMANVRSATPGQAVHIGNTQPFTHRNLHFLHNGYIEAFQEGFKEKLVPLIDPDILARLQGDTDSAWLAALFHQQLKSTGSIREALVETCRELQSIADGKKILMNMIVSDQDSLHAVRHAINADCPSLYSLVNGQNFPDSVILASEPFDDDPGWTAIETHRSLSVGRDLNLQMSTIEVPGS
ncbi:MAG: ergothioneine biosynthesis protein EgtC [Gammaproteobacteria bacterium]|nr:ergothioneine biosynthesis protein EgtC [Gammaproteobacteria bacterium]